MTVATPEKHAMEDDKSWHLFMSRNTRRLAKDHGDPPPIHDETQHGMMIDAGSQGTRIHIYEFEARVLKHRHEIEHAVQGKRLTFPSTNSRWSARLKPGLDTFAFASSLGDQHQAVAAYLGPLLEFAKSVLAKKQKDWHEYPIYLKATGGLRTLPRPYRLQLIQVVRDLFHNTSFNPFFFEEEHARVISGEEEAIYGWTAVNFVKNSLIRNSEGSGAVSPANLTYGVLEMGGASTQIGFFEPNGDVMANLFKLQIGAAKHWNVYAHSFLYFGVNGAFARLNARMVAKESNQQAHGVYNPCLPGGSTYNFTSRVHFLPNGTLLPISSPSNASLLVAPLTSTLMINDEATGDYQACADVVYQLLRKDSNGWCDFAHDRDCSFAGIYQPPLPIDEDHFGEFIATSNFYEVWAFLGLEGRVPLSQVRARARQICAMNATSLAVYNEGLPSPVDDDELPQFCFRSTFISEFLIEGVGFPENYEVTAIDVVDGQKLGWALGSMLYEINTLPWTFHKKSLKKMTSSLLARISPSDPTSGRWPGTIAILCVVAMWVRFRRWRRSEWASIPEHAE